MKIYLPCTLALFNLLSCAYAQEKPAPAPKVDAATSPAAPAELPGKGLSQHDFFYAGEGNKVMSIVKKGEVVWTYTDTTKKGEISDAVLLSNGNVLFAHQWGVTVIDKDRRMIWNHDAPTSPKTEIHTARPIGKDLVLFVQNADHAKVTVVNIVTNKTVFEMELPVGNPLSTHGQFRHVSLTDAGTLLVAHMDMAKVSEYNVTGKVLWSVNVDHPWGAERLKNGNTLISGNTVKEVNPKGETIWEFTAADAPEYNMKNMQRATRLSNGNTLINRWQTKGDGSGVQAIEVSPDKKVVWALHSWGPVVDLGRSTTIQILDDPKLVPENEHFGPIK